MNSCPAAKECRRACIEQQTGAHEWLPTRTPSCRSHPRPPSSAAWEPVTRTATACDGCCFLILSGNLEAWRADLNSRMSLDASVFSDGCIIIHPLYIYILLWQAFPSICTWLPTGNALPVEFRAEPLLPPNRQKCWDSYSSIAPHLGSTRQVGRILCMSFPWISYIPVHTLKSWKRAWNKNHRWASQNLLCRRARSAKLQSDHSRKPCAGPSWQQMLNNFREILGLLYFFETSENYTGVIRYHYE